MNEEKKLDTISIKGKEYVLVNTRLKYFREHFKNYAMISEIVEMSPDRVCIMAKIYDENGNIKATGTAYEEKQASFINKTSYVENCETSAWGRALANFGIGVDENVASADEVANAIKNQNAAEKTPKTASDPIREEAVNNPKPVTDSQAAVLEGIFNSQPDGGRILRTLLLNGKEINELTNVEYAEALHKLNSKTEENRKAVKQYIKAYADVKKIKASEALEQIQTALNVKIPQDIGYDCSELFKKIQELAEK